jgi:hypothetical protein
MGKQTKGLVQCLNTQYVKPVIITTVTRLMANAGDTHQALNKHHPRTGHSP